MSGTEEDERKAQFVSMLPGTLEALCSMQATPRDDTILHHLLDTIRALIVSEDDAKGSGLLDFVDTVREKAQGLSSAVLVLALGVAGHLTSVTCGAGDSWQRLTSLYDVIQSSVVTGNSSVGVAYFDSLAKVVASTAGLHWLENRNVHFQTALSTLETAQSIFVLNAAEKFVLTTLTNSLEANNPNLLPSSPSSSLVVDGMKLLTNELMDMKSNRATLLDQMIVRSHVSSFHQSVAKLVCALTGLRTFCEWKMGDEAFVTALAHLALQHSSGKIQSSALQSVVNLIGYMKGETKEEFLKKKVLSPLLKLVTEGRVERGIAVAFTFVKSCPNKEDSEALTVLQKLTQLPHDLLFGRPVQCTELTGLVSAVNTSLCDQQSFSMLISSLLQSVKQTLNSEGLVRLVLSAATTREDEVWPSVVSSWPQGVGANVVNNRKLLNSLMDLLQQDNCLDLTLQQGTEVLMCLMRIMRRPLIESRQYSQTCAAFRTILCKQHNCLDPGETGGMDKVLTHWVELMEYRLVSLQWEIRDTTLELIRHVLAIVSDPSFHVTLRDHHLLRLAWSCTKYGESYPRATAISLGTSLVSSNLWDAFLQDAGISEATLADDMVEVVANDSEAFVRRAAVLLLTALVPPCVQSSPSSPPSDRTGQRHKICQAMTNAMSDFDWDVKLKVLGFWEKLATPLFPCEKNAENGDNVNVKHHTAMSDCQSGRKRPAPNQKRSVNSKEHCDLLETLLKDGFGKALWTGAEDYDLAVKQKALHMLVSLQQRLEVEENPPVKAQRLNRESDMNSFLLSVSELDPISLLQQQSQSADEYERKPVSILEDVMAAVSVAVSASEVTLMSEDEFDDADDMFVDCY